MNRLSVLRIVLVVQLGLLLIWYSTKWGRKKHTTNENVSDPRPAPPVTPNVCKALAAKQIGEVSSDEISICHQMEPFLWSYIKRRHVIEPSELPYTFKRQRQGDIIKALWPVLQRETKGQSKKIFVEVGVSNGILGSNTIWLEESQGWTGVLIECRPFAVPTLLKWHRKAHIVDTCLSQTEFPTKVTGASMDDSTKYEVQALPLYSILAAIGITVVDFFSLDIQGEVLHVLQTLPFDLIHVQAWVIETNSITPKEKDILVQLMVSKGYRISDILDKESSELVFVSRRE